MVWKQLQIVDPRRVYPGGKKLATLILELEISGHVGLGTGNHKSVCRHPASFSRVAIIAGCHDILPTVGATSAPWGDMVKAQIIGAKAPKAILTGELVPEEDIVSCEGWSCLDLNKSLQSHD
mmetsp:Transcript_16359/g.26832  ORF Transcript_16359/g.26832 Transcript_16359/m.26832 type:complete len:122 (+) Transcript_16359:744-1109(+)